MPAMTTTAPSLQQDAQIAFAVLVQREDLVLRRIDHETERYGHPNEYWASPENLGLETYSLARRCRWARADGKPDVNRARNAIEYLIAHGAVVTLQKYVSPVRAYYVTLGMYRALERANKQ